MHPRRRLCVCVCIGTLLSFTFSCFLSPRYSKNPPCSWLTLIFFLLPFTFTLPILSTPLPSLLMSSPPFIESPQTPSSSFNPSAVDSSSTIPADDSFSEDGYKQLKRKLREIMEVSLLFDCTSVTRVHTITHTCIIVYVQ